MPRKGIFSLRNPLGEPKTFQVNLKDIFELSRGKLSSFRLENKFSSAGRLPQQVVSPGNAFLITLAPYELKILEATPEKAGVRKTVNVNE